MPDSLHEIPIEAAPEVVYGAWTTEEGLSSWWTKVCRISGTPGGINIFVFDGGNVEFHFRVDDQVPGRRVRWTGVAASKMPAEWVDTRIEVDIERSDDETILRFSHRNWKAIDGMYCVCNTTWGELMYRCRDYCEQNGHGPLFEG